MRPPVLAWDPLARLVPVEIHGGGEVLDGLPRGSAADGDEWHEVAKVSPDAAPWTMVVAAVDPSSGLKGGKHDAIGLCVVGITSGGRAVIRVAKGRTRRHDARRDERNSEGYRGAWRQQALD